VHLIAEHGGDSMLPRLGMMRALHRHYEQPAPPLTKTAN
jgi:hypothetical protein